VTRLAVLGIVLFAATAGAGERTVRVEGGRITVRLDGIAAHDVLDDIARATGARVDGTLHSPDQPVVASFDELPLDEGMRRLFGSQAFSLTYRDDQVAAIRFIDRAEPGTPLITGSDAELATRRPVRALPDEGATLEERARTRRRDVAALGARSGAVGGIELQPPPE
jgi:hypothetical protein